MLWLALRGIWRYRAAPMIDASKKPSPNPNADAGIGTGQTGAQMIPAWRDGVLCPVEKLAVHQLGLRHPAVSVFVRRGDDILLQQRALTKYHTPGLWANTCCTHPHWGEAAITCAQRRLAEELGITGLTLTPRGEIEYRADVGQGLIEHEMVQLFVADAPDDMVIRHNADEVHAVHWRALPDLIADIAVRPADFTPWLRIYLADHAAEILG